jgi:hypothetical protein
MVTRSTSRLPSSVMPRLERRGCGGVSKTPDCISMPVGRPSSHVQKSPLTPATVALADARLCIEVTVSRPSSESLDRSGRSA